jgi:microcystin degradation protein MlrC
MRIAAFNVNPHSPIVALGDNLAALLLDILARYKRGVVGMSDNSQAPSLWAKFGIGPIPLPAART